MNTSIIQKCIEELKQPTPKIDYILGMLETFVAMSAVAPNLYVPQYPPLPNIYPVTVATNSQIPIEEEGSGIIAAYAGNPGSVGTI